MLICLHVRSTDIVIGGLARGRYSGVTWDLQTRRYSYMRRRTSSGKDKKSPFDTSGDIRFILCSKKIGYFVKSNED